MAIRDCVPEIKALTGDRLSDDQINQIIEELNRRQKERRARGAAERDDDLLMQEAQKMVGDIDIAAKMAKRNRALNVLARKRITEFVDAAIADGLRPDEAIQALNIGLNRDVRGGRLSVDAKGVALFEEYLGGMVADLRRAGVLEHLTRRGGLLGSGRGALDREIARELRAVSAGEGPATASQEARTIAEIINKHQERARQRLNRSGGWAGKRWDYIVRQTHNQLKVRQAGFEEWEKFIFDLLDHEATFGDANPSKFLKSAYDGIQSGIHLKHDGAASPPEGVFTGPANLAKKVSAERVLHFKDADAWAAYNDRFGTQNLLEAVVMGLETSARSSALMETWGPNPRSMFNDVVKRLREQHRENPKLVDRLGSKLVKQFNEIDGTTRQIENITAAHIASSVRAAQSMAKLGGAVVSSITDLVTYAAELRWQGENLGAAYAKAFGSLFEDMGAKESRVVADLLGVGMDGITGDIAARFGPTDTVPGKMAKVQRLFFKMNLLSYWTDAHKRSLGRTMARRFAMLAGTPMKDMDARMQRVFRAYGLDEADWDVIRQAKTVMADGREYLTADAIRDLHDDALGPLTAERVQKIEDDIARRTQAARKANDAARLQTLPAERARRLKSVRERTLDRLETSMRALLSDRVNSGIPTPGARERALMHQGSMRGTFEGEFWRFMMQFKAFPITFATKVLGRETGGYGIREALLQGKGDLVGMASLIAGATIMGMGAMQAKEILKGRSPRDPFGPNWGSTWNAAFLQGGGAGIFGDFLFGEYNRFGRSAIATAAGPTFGTVDDLAELFARMRSGDDFGGSLVRTVQSNSPFLNLFYARAAMDYLVIYQLQEAMNPGYLRRMEQRIERENDQTFLLRPSEVVQ